MVARRSVWGGGLVGGQKKDLGLGIEGGRIEEERGGPSPTLPCCYEINSKRGGSCRLFLLWFFLVVLYFSCVGFFRGGAPPLFFRRGLKNKKLFYSLLLVVKCSYSLLKG